MADAPIPVYEDLAPIYGEGTEEARARYEKIKAAFEERFGAPPDLFARSPGRVNLIGEHIDYEGYGVLPMAIKQDTVIAVRRAGDELVVTNLESGKYRDAHFSVDPKQDVDTSNHSWANYFLAAYKGVFEHLEGSGGEVPQPAGLQVMVHGLVPTGSGLSSSAALTCSTSLALLGAYGVTLTKGEVSDFTCRCERYVGTESGGMDQAISVMGMPNTALQVDFNPIRVADVALPPGATFVVANSLTVSNKAETGPLRYNMRVVECRLAAALLALALGHSKARATLEAARKVLTLQEVEPLIAGKADEADGEGAAAGGSAANRNVAAALAHLHAEPYSAAEVAEALGTPLEDLLAGNASQLRVLPVAAQSGGFKLQQRAAHVYSETVRVHEFAAVCASDAPAEQKLERLGRLMDESQASCRDLYECSCEELDALVATSKEAGAIGSRLTGAGWGGCTVSLVRQEGVEAFIDAVKAQYYAPLVEAGRVAEAELGECIFATQPAAGGAVLKLKL